LEVDHQLALDLDQLFEEDLGFADACCN